MITSLSSGADSKNPDFLERLRERGDNIKWLKANAVTLGDGLVIGLVGGWSHTHLPLRMAQASLRHDRTPSNWSHVFVFQRFGKEIKTSQDLGTEIIYEVSLDHKEGFDYAPLENGLQTSPVSRYRDAREFPNIAVFSMTLDEKEEDPQRKVAVGIGRFRGKQGAVDATALILRWLGYVWGIGGNPLLEGFGMPSAALVEELALELGFDLTPGVESRASCPEAIWQAARWWHEYYNEVNQRPLQGAWCTSQWLLFKPKVKRVRRSRGKG